MKKLTRQQAIEQNCFDCNADSADVGSRHAQVESCVTIDCPFYEYRPLTTATLNKRRAERYEAMTPKEKLAYDKRAQATRERFGHAQS